MLLRALYFCLKRFGALLAHSYYRITFMNRVNFNLPKGPCIMTINHPNTMMDIISIVPFVNRQPHFLANASLFVNPIINRLLRTLWCIPIKRKSDTGSRINNEDSFAECTHFLSGGGLLLIAPEGSSRNERHIRSFRTGTALIAFRTEAENDFKLGLKICPFGITYDKPWAFRSRVYIQAEKPLRVSDYRGLYLENPQLAITQLTADLEEKTRAMTVDTADRMQEKLLSHLEILSNNRHFKKYGKWMNGLERFQLAQKLVFRLKKIQTEQIEEYKTLEKQTGTYFSSLSKLNVSAYAVTLSIYGNALWLRALFIVVMLPFFLLGLLLNIIPLLLTELAWRLMPMEDYEATIRTVLGGLIFFPLSYSLSTWSLSPYFHFPLFGLLYWTISVLLGIFAWDYFRTFRLFVKMLRAKTFDVNTKTRLQKELNMVREVSQHLVQ